MSSLTLAAAVSVSGDHGRSSCGRGARERMLPECRLRPRRSGRAPGRRGSWNAPHLAGRRRPSTKPSTRPRCRPHTRSGLASASSRNGQWVKAIVAPSVVADGLGIEAERARARSISASMHGAVLGPAPRRRPRPCSRPASAASSPSRPASAGQPQQHAGQQRERPAARGRATGRRRPASSRCWGRPTPPWSSMRTSSRPTSRMRSRWGRTVLACRSRRVGDLGGGQRAGRAGQLEVDGVPGVVAQRLQELEASGGSGRRLGHGTSLHGRDR